MSCLSTVWRFEESNHYPVFPLRRDVCKRWLDETLVSRSPLAVFSDNTDEFSPLSTSRSNRSTWLTNEDVFLDMSGLRIGKHYRYRLVVTNTSGDGVRLGAVPISLPEFLVVTCPQHILYPVSRGSTWLFLLSLSSLPCANRQGMSAMVTVSVDPTSIVECVGFVDISAYFPSLPADYGEKAANLGVFLAVVWNLGALVVQR